MDVVLKHIRNLRMTMIILVTFANYELTKFKLLTKPIKTAAMKDIFVTKFIALLIITYTTTPPLVHK